MKGIFSFLVGIYVGVVASQRYHVPRTPTPSEAWDEFKSKRRERHRSRYDYECQDEERRQGRQHPTMDWSKEQLPYEIREAIDKIKAFERRFRKPQYRDFESEAPLHRKPEQSPTQPGERAESPNGPPEWFL